MSEKKEEAALEKLSELETVCPECDGKGYWIHMETTKIRCDKCKGRKEVLTPLGEQVLNLVWRHFEGMRWLSNDE